MGGRGIDRKKQGEEGKERGGEAGAEGMSSSDRRGRGATGEEDREGEKGKEERKREQEAAGTRSQPASEICRPRRGGEARGEHGEERTRAAGSDPWKPGDVTGPRLASCPRPRHPRPARAEGAPGEPRPGPEASGRLLPARPPRPPALPPASVYPVPSRCAAAERGTSPPALPPAGGRGEEQWGGFRGVPGAAGRGTHDAHTGKDRWMPVSLEARGGGRSQRAPGTCGPISPAGANRGAPCPHHRAPTLDSQGPAPWPSHSPWKAPLPAGALDWARRGLGVEARGVGGGGPASPRRGERLITPGSPGMPGPWRLLPPLGASQASSPLPSGTSLPATATSPGEGLRLQGQGAGSGSWEGDGCGVGGGGSPQRPRRRSCRADGNSEGGKLREDGSLSSLRVNNTCPTPRDAFSSRASLTSERFNHAKVTERDEGRAGEHILVPR
uniref:Uncharacterized protein n=1 Tax=Rangifer tarandus platyrhynchus TaxID=3082113 RepID=A0ACB0EQM1_RANTA|nr:unnamed protein product [Rangifer tarandus platyrhynchus]